MPGFALLTTSPPLLAAALAAAAPATVPPPLPEPAGPIVPIAWSLAAAQQDAQPAETTPPMTEIVVEGQVGPPKSDPAEAINEASFEVAQAVDRVLVEPLATGYSRGLPEPLRDGFGNVVRNLSEPTNALNFLLQGKFGKAFETLGRLALNSTVGVGGLFDVAGKRAKLPYRRNGFANTMGFYGIGPGPYLYLPITGPTSVRDQIGVTLDQAILPFAIGKPFNRPEYAISFFVINGLESRLRDEPQLDAIEKSDDPYVARRETYLAQRRRDIALLRGDPVSPEDERLLEDMKMPPPPVGPYPRKAPADDTPVEPPANPESLLITQPR